MGTLLDSMDAADRALVVECGELAAARDMYAFLVGGAVRDLLLGVASPDLDILVVGDAIVVAQDFARARGGEVQRHHAFQTATVILPSGRRRVDFVTARSETYAKPGVLPAVTAGTLVEDLERRDFTVNTIALSLAPGSVGELTDPFAGEQALRTGEIRFLHEQSFADDPTRILRALRFALRLGYEIEPRTAVALRDAAQGGFLADVTGDRVRRELGKLLSEQPVDGPEALAHWGLLTSVFPGLDVDVAALRRLAEIVAQRATDLEWMVLALLARNLDPQTRWDLARRLKLPRAGQRIVIDSGEPWRRVLAQLDELPAESAASEFAEYLDALSVAVLQVSVATLADDALRQRIERYLASDRDTQPSLKGSDLIELGCPEGEQIGVVLRALRRARIDGAITDVAGEKALVRDLVAGAN